MVTSTQSAKMTMKFKDTELEAKFRQYAEDKGLSLTELFNLAMAKFFDTPQVFSSDPIENLESIKEYLDFIDWDKAKARHEEIKKNVLTRDTSLAQVLASATLEAIADSTVKD